MYMIIKKIYKKTFYFELFNLDRLFYCLVYVYAYILDCTPRLDSTHDCLKNNILYRRMKYGYYSEQ